MTEETNTSQRSSELSVLYVSKLKSPVYSKKSPKEFILSPIGKVNTPTKRSITNVMSNFTSSSQKASSTPETATGSLHGSFKSYQKPALTSTSKRQRSFVMDYGSSQKMTTYSQGNMDYFSSPSFTGPKQRNASQGLTKISHSHELNLPVYISPEKKSLLQETPPSALSKNKRHLSPEESTRAYDKVLSKSSTKRVCLRKNKEEGASASVENSKNVSSTSTEQLKSDTPKPRLEKQSLEFTAMEKMKSPTNALYTPPRPIPSLSSISSISSKLLKSHKGKEVELHETLHKPLEKKGCYADVLTESVLNGRDAENLESGGSFNQGISSGTLENIEQSLTPTSCELNTFFEPTKMQPRCYESPKVQMDISHEAPINSTHPSTTVKAPTRITPTKQPAHTDTTHERASSPNLIANELKRSRVISLSSYESQESPRSKSTSVMHTDNLTNYEAEKPQNISKSIIELSSGTGDNEYSITAIDTQSDFEDTLSLSKTNDLSSFPKERVQISQRVESNEISLQESLISSSKSPTEQVSSTPLLQDSSPNRDQYPSQTDLRLDQQLPCFSIDDSFVSIKKNILDSILGMGDLFFQAMYILDRLFPLSCSRAFISSRGTSRLYTPREPSLNLTSLERAIWQGKYSSLEDFKNDLNKVASMVKESYDDTDVVFFVARDFKQVLDDVINEVYTTNFTHEIRMDFQQYWEASTFNKVENLYAVRILNQEEAERSHMELLAKEITESIHFPILDLPNHPFEPRVVRLFVSQNRSLLETCRDDSNGIFLVMSNLQYDKIPNSKKTVILKGDCFACKPFGVRHDINEVEILQSLDSTKTWIKVLVIKAIKLELEIPNSTRLQLNKAFKPFLCKYEKLREYITAELAHLTSTELDGSNKPQLSEASEERLKVLADLTTPLDVASHDHNEIRPTTPQQPSPEPSKADSPGPDENLLSAQYTPSTLINSIRTSTSPVPKQEAISPVLRFESSVANKIESNENLTAIKLSRPSTPALFSNDENSLMDPEEALVLDSTTHEAGESSQSGKQYTTWNEKMKFTNQQTSPKHSLGLTSTSSESASKNKDKRVIPIASIKFSRELDNPIEEVDERPVKNPILSVIQPRSAIELYQHFKIFAYNHGVKVEKLDVNYRKMMSSDAVNGFFKSVHGHLHNPDVVIQLYKEINESTFQGCLMEVLCLTKLKGTKRIGEIMSILENESNQLAGLTMFRCQRTLKDYLHARHKITPQQKYKIIRDMIVAVKVMHENGIAHRDLSEINVMINEKPDSLLKDKSLRPKAVVIDFGRALFVRAEDVSKWSARKYSLEELKLLPKIHTSPDHGYKRYRSICTLPKHKQDHDLLPYPVDPLAEDIYSLGILIWRTLSQQNPWPGVFDEDIRGLREIVGNEERMHKEICKSVKGAKCREILFGCLAVNPQERWTSKTLFDWIWNAHNRRKLIREFEAHFQGRNASRKASILEV